MEAPQNFFSKLGPRERHGQRGGTGALFSFDNFITSELDPMNEVLVLLIKLKYQRFVGDYWDDGFPE